ncbi:unnamed protein product [Amoebophrya sp. A25]|nr:unnamed protein product [Amoebophrya sp. A25]|eukprot:GSA25T00004151001.1
MTKALEIADKEAEKENEKASKAKKGGRGRGRNTKVVKAKVATTAIATEARPGVSVALEALLKLCKGIFALHQRITSAAKGSVQEFSTPVDWYNIPAAISTLHGLNPHSDKQALGVVKLMHQKIGKAAFYMLRSEADVTKLKKMIDGKVTMKEKQDVIDKNLLSPYYRLYPALRGNLQDYASGDIEEIDDLDGGEDGEDYDDEYNDEESDGVDDGASSDEDIDDAFRF